MSGVALLALGGEASAAKAPPPKAKDVSAISQYRESIPSGSGPILPGNTSSRTPLPPATARKVEIQGGTDTHTLRKLAEESNFGAPPRHALPVVPRQVVVDNDQHGLPSAVFMSAGNLVGANGNSHLTGLVVIMGLIALGAAASALRRRTT